MSDETIGCVLCYMIGLFAGVAITLYQVLGRKR